MSTTTYDSLESGIAVLADESNAVGEGADGPWQVNGVALPENAITVGQSGTPRYWPADTLADAADELIGRPIVKNFHELDGQAPADDVIGTVTDTGYADGVGIVYEGEISDEAIAKKVARGYLDVSVVPSIADESYDEQRDARRVEAIAGFRDIAVVAEGAAKGADIELGPNPAVAALSRNLLAEHAMTDGVNDALDDETADDGGDDTEPTDDDAETADGEAADGADEPETDGDDASDEPESLNAALARELSIHTPDRCRTIKDGAQTFDPTEDPVARDILGVTSSKPRDVRDDALARRVVGMDDDAAESPADADTVSMDDDDMARRAVGLDPDTESKDTPDDPDEPETVDVESDAIARSALGLEVDDADLDEIDEQTRGAIGLEPGTSARDGDDDESDEPDVIDVSSDPVARSALDLPVNVDVTVEGDDGGDDADGETDDELADE